MNLRAPEYEEKSKVLNHQFKLLTGFPPLSWQSRLFSEYLEQGELPAAVDIPTGLGKTAVMALWLIARAKGAALPRRLVYVVDRRAVVDQATEFAMSLRDSIDKPDAVDLKRTLGLGERSLPISTLRGQHIDNREWLEDPALAAIIVATVDMIGSRLLFEGYGISRKMRPYHAGLLGADTLVVLDEAHLVPPFEKLLDAIENGVSQFGAHEADERKLIPAFKLLSLSATGRERPGKVFRLDEKDIKGDKTAAKRLKAKKAATLTPVNRAKLEDILAEKAWELTGKGRAPRRCLVFCDKREIAEKSINAIQARAKGDGIEIDTELFVGARRVLERVDAAVRLGALGFLAGSEVVRTRPAFLIATSAGEVGVDLDADHMVCDLVAWERMVQRLGRVNRRGDGDAKVIIVDGGSPQPKKQDNPTPQETETIERHQALHKLIKALPKRDDGFRDASPEALLKLKMRSAKEPNLRELIVTATTATPLRPALTRALVDAWSMTSLEEHTGRPEVEPWLRGWIKEDPRTEVVWRNYLPVRTDGSQATRKEVEAFFEAAPPHMSETLEIETWRVTSWLMERATALTKRSALKTEGTRGAESPEETSVALQEDGMPLQKGDIIAFVLSSGGDLHAALSLGDIVGRDSEITKKKEELQRKLAGATLVVNSRFGGLHAGLLNVESNDQPRCADDGGDWIKLSGNAAQTGKSVSSLPPVIRFRVRSLQPGQILEYDRNWRERLRFDAERGGDGETVRWLVVDKWRHDAATEEDRSAGRPQVLDEHQSWTEKKARDLAQRIGLDSDYVVMLACAARLHDEGKRAERWQRAFNAPRDGKTYAKTRGPLNPALLDGYRHEFGSLPYAEVDESFRKLPSQMQDLVLHLISAHHGQARPVISTKSCEDAPPSALEQRAREVALRFARLQKRWGPWGLAWWEALLRAADQQASRDNDALDSIGNEENI